MKIAQILQPVAQFKLTCAWRCTPHAYTHAHTHTNWYTHTHTHIGLHIHTHTLSHTRDTHTHTHTHTEPRAYDGKVGDANRILYRVKGWSPELTHIHHPPSSFSTSHTISGDFSFLSSALHVPYCDGNANCLAYSHRLVLIPLSYRQPSSYHEIRSYTSLWCSIYLQAWYNY